MFPKKRIRMSLVKKFQTVSIFISSLPSFPSILLLIRIVQRGKKIKIQHKILLNCRDMQWCVCTEVLKYGTNKHCLAFFFPFSTNLNVEEKLYKDNEQFTYVFNMIFLD